MCEVLHPKALDGVGKLHKFTTAESPDGAAFFDPQPRNPPSNRRRAAAKKLRSLLQDLADRCVGLEMLAGGEKVENRIGVHIRQLTGDLLRRLQSFSPVRQSILFQ